MPTGGPRNDTNGRPWKLSLQVHALSLWMQGKCFIILTMLQKNPQFYLIKQSTVTMTHFHITVLNIIFLSYEELSVCRGKESVLLIQPSCRTTHNLSHQTIHHNHDPLPHHSLEHNILELRRGYQLVGPRKVFYHSNHVAEQPTIYLIKQSTITMTHTTLKLELNILDLWRFPSEFIWRIRRLNNVNNLLKLGMSIYDHQKHLP